jgi:hypothetical protein
MNSLDEKRTNVVKRTKNERSGGDACMSKSEFGSSPSRSVVCNVLY